VVAAIALLPDVGPLAWISFALASVAGALALALVPDSTEYGAAALLAAIALKDGVTVVGSASVGVFHVAALALALVWIIRLWRASPRPADARGFRLSVLEWALAGPFVAGLWSLPTSLHTTKTVLYSGRLLLLWAIAVLVARSLATERGRHRALMWFVGGSVALACVGLAQWGGLPLGHVAIQGNSLDGTLITRPAGFYLDPNFLGAHLVLGAAGGLALALGRGRSWWWLASLAPMLAVVALTYSRSSWLALVLGLLACVALAPRGLRVRLAVFVVAAGIVGVALVGPSSLLARVTSIFELESGSSSATRLLMAEAMVDMIADRPVFGTGLEAFTEAYSTYRLPGALVAVSHPHNVPLALIAETGIAGLIVQIIAITAVLSAVRRRWRAGPSDVDVWIVACLVALFASAVLQFVLYFEPMWLVVGVLAGAALDAPGASVSGPRRDRRG
jgi:O-antigen ligase